ncbi:MAG: diguanylate cyclase [Thermodesulfobacteriota bacterium]
MKKSLRTKFTLLLLLVGVLPLACTSIFFYYTTKDAFFSNVFKELRWNIDEVAVLIENHFADTSKNLLFASQNAAFRMYFLDPGKKGYWLTEQKKTLRSLRKTYPDIVDEACFIDNTGHEISRIVYDRIAPEEELSSEEERAAFFKKAFLMDEGEVFQGRPMISEDTGRWVLPNATPIMVNGKKKAILHFEVTMSYFQLLLKRHINPERGYGFIVNSDGEFMAHTLMDLSGDEPFPMAVGADTSFDLERIIGRMMNGERGIEEFSQGGKGYYVIFKPISSSYVKGRNENRWSIGYAISSDRLYVELAILRYNLIAIGGTLLLVAGLAYLLGNYVTRPIRELAKATRKLARGEMPRVSSRRDDEIGQLSVSFNLMAEAVKRRDDALKSLAVTDGLTGLFNQRYFKSELEKAVKVAGRYGRPMALLIADVDFFKDYNDANGHLQGDMALKKVAEVLMKYTREVDLVARYGGEEFVVMLPETGLDGALEAAERIRAGLEAEAVPFEEMQPHGRFSVSIGVAVYPGDAKDPVSLLDAADKALYAAKKKGRNIVVAYREV